MKNAEKWWVDQGEMRCSIVFCLWEHETRSSSVVHVWSLGPETKLKKSWYSSPQGALPTVVFTRSFPAAALPEFTA
jgi:hypothetical protein